ncbi:MAG: Gfo/Idh/MocA family oxidoreductase [Kiritimatiellia bacterium]
MKTVKFGIIGGGLMGREFASAAARWCHLTDIDVRPEIVAVCDLDPAAGGWFSERFASVSQVTTDHHELLANPEVEAVYIAVPHNLHAAIFCEAITAGKHLMGEKPFGIDLAANQQIKDCMEQHPEVFVRCSSESPFFPAVQRIGGMLEEGAFGGIIEVSSGFLHSSDLDPEKPINWKRIIEFNGEYGVMGDLGIHACHVGLRAGWQPRNVRALLANIIKERPDGKGGRVPCETWDNATLLCETVDSSGGDSFPWTIKTHRIAPGQKNNWYVEILGTKASARWSSVNSDILESMKCEQGDQVWGQIQTGHETAFKTITGEIFQFGFSDSILQMWAAFLYELHHGKPISRFAGCATPEEVSVSHQLFTAALQSQKEKSVAEVQY